MLTATNAQIYKITTFLTWTSDKIKNLAIIHLIFIVSEVHTKMASPSAEDAKQRTQKLSRVKKLTYIVYLLLIASELVVRALHLLMFRKDPQTLNILASLELACKVAFFLFDVYFIIAMVLPSMNYFRDLKASSTESGHLTSYQRAVVALFYALIVLHLLSGLLVMVYPISVLVDGEFNGIDWPDALFGFIMGNVCDFLSSLGFLFVFYKMSSKLLEDERATLIVADSLVDGVNQQVLIETEGRSPMIPAKVDVRLKLESQKLVQDAP